MKWFTGKAFFLGLLLAFWAQTRCFAVRPSLLWLRGGHIDTVKAVAVSPDGLSVASASTNGSILLWRTSDGALIRTFSEDGEVRWLGFSPDSQTLFTGALSSQGVSVKFWVAGTGVAQSSLLIPATLSVSAFAFSGDGTAFAAAGTTADTTSVTQVSVWSVQTGQPSHTLNGDFGAVSSLAFAPNGSFLAIGTGKNQLDLWTLQDTQPRTLDLKTNVTALAVSPDSQQVAEALQDGTLELRQVSDGQVIQTMRPPGTETVPSVAYSLAFSPNGQVLASGDAPRATVELWNVANGQLLKGFSHTPFGTVTGVAFFPDSQSLVSGVDGSDTGTGLKDDTAKIWRASDGQLLQTLGDPTLSGSVGFSADGQTLFTPGYGKFQIRRADTGQSTGSLAAVGQSVTYPYAFSANGLAFAWGQDTAVNVAQTADGAVTRTVNGLSSATALALSPDGQTLAVANDEGVGIWSISTGQSIKTLNTSLTDDPNALAFSPDGKTVAVDAGDAIELYDAATGVLSRTLSPVDSLFALAFSPDGQTLASGGEDRKVTLWNLLNGQTIQVYDEETGLGITGLAFSPDGKTFAINRQDGIVELAQNLTVPVQLPGDINGDGKISVQDAILALQISVGSLTPTTAQKQAADINSDGNVNIADAILLLRKAIGL